MEKRSARSPGIRAPRVTPRVGPTSRRWRRPAGRSRFRRWPARSSPFSAPTGCADAEVLRSAPLPCAELAGTHLGLEPAGQRLAGLDGVADALLRRRTVEPGAWLPASARHQAATS